MVIYSISVPWLTLLAFCGEFVILCHFTCTNWKNRCKKYCRGTSTSSFSSGTGAELLITKLHWFLYASRDYPLLWSALTEHESLYPGQLPAQTTCRVGGTSRCNLPIAAEASVTKLNRSVAHIFPPSSTRYFDSNANELIYSHRAIWWFAA